MSVSPKSNKPETLSQDGKKAKAPKERGRKDDAYDERGHYAPEYDSNEFAQTGSHTPPKGAT